MASSGTPFTPPPSGPRPPKSKTSRNNLRNTTPGGTGGVTPPKSDTGRPPRRPRNVQHGRGGVTRPGRTAASGFRPRDRPRERDPDLQAQLEAAGIEVFLPSDIEYERAVACSNLLYRFSRPTYVVRPKNHSHVQLIVTEAITRKIPLAIRNGGHSYIGSSFPNDGIMLDLKNMNEVLFDWTLVDADDGWMVNGGRCPTVGVSGFILGGGIGPFSRQYGMACDNVLEMTVAAADGELYVVTAEDDPDSPEGQLFWALCGAGGANFGVVCEIKIRVHYLTAIDPVADRKNHPSRQVVAGRHVWYPTIDRSPRPLFGGLATPGAADDSNMGLLATMNHFYTAAWPDRITIDTSWLSDLQVSNGDIGVRFLTYFDGDQKEFNRLIGRGILNAELSKQLQRRSLAENSSRFLHETLFAQWDEEAKRSTPANSSFRIFNSFCFTNKPDEIAKITAIIKEELEAFKRLFAGEGSGLCQVTWIHSGGVMSNRDRDATAFRWRETVYHSYIQVQWRDKWLERDMRGFANKFKNRLRQFSIAGKASFINFPDASIPKVDVTKAYYGNNRDKLAQIKRVWDPDNFFKWEQGINVAEEDNEQAQEQAEMNSKVTELELSDADEEDPDVATDRITHDRWEERGSHAQDPLLTIKDDPVQINLHYGGGNSSSGSNVSPNTNSIVWS